MKIEELLRQSNLIEGFDDPEADACALRAWEYLKKVELDDLHHSDIREIHRLLVDHQDDLGAGDVGNYRRIQVYVGDHIPPSGALVPAQMSEWLNNVKEAPALVHHVAYETIHPFVDGNGRTGRLLLWWTQYQRNHKFTEITLANRANYYQWFRDRRITQDETLLRILYGVNI